MAASTKSVVHVRVDERVKAKATKALAAMGLSVSDAVRVLLTRVAADKALPFEVKTPNAKTRAAMAELERGRLKSYATFAEAMADRDAPGASDD
jgi:DNA-damage-inducible protein J